jgi:hypothetical protein
MLLTPFYPLFGRIKGKKTTWNKVEEDVLWKGKSRGKNVPSFYRLSFWYSYTLAICYIYIKNLNLAAGLPGYELNACVIAHILWLRGAWWVLEPAATNGIKKIVRSPTKTSRHKTNERLMTLVSWLCVDGLQVLHHKILISTLQKFQVIEIIANFPVILHVRRADVVNLIASFLQQCRFSRLWCSMLKKSAKNVKQINITSIFEKICKVSA